MRDAFLPQWNRFPRTAVVAVLAIAALAGISLIVRARFISHRFVVYLDVSDHRSRAFLSHVLPRLRRELGTALRPKIVVVPMTDDAAPLRGAIASACADKQRRLARFLEEWTGVGGGAATEYAMLLAATRAEMNLDRFKSCLVSDRQRRRVLRLRDKLARKGLRAVPAFEIGREKLSADAPFGLVALRLQSIHRGTLLPAPKLTVIEDPSCDACPTSEFIGRLESTLGVKLDIVREDVRMQPGGGHALKWGVRRVPTFAFEAEAREHIVFPDLEPMVEERPPSLRFGGGDRNDRGTPAPGVLLVKADLFPGPSAFAAIGPSLPVPSLGKREAPIRFRIYCDLQGPACREFYRRDFPEIKRRFVDAGRMSLEWVPCSWSEASTQAAAQEAVCLDREKRFWKHLERQWGGDVFPKETVRSNCAGTPSAAAGMILRTCTENQITAQPSYQIGRLFVGGYTEFGKLEPLLRSPLASAKSPPQ